LDFDRKSAREAAEIVTKLKVKRKSIDKPDLFIAATAIVNGLTLDTLNVKDFFHIESLNLLNNRNGG
jgi:tRNA(fMet)-specific endonuclease VapC